MRLTQGEERQLDHLHKVQGIPENYNEVLELYVWTHRVVASMMDGDIALIKFKTDLTYLRHAGRLLFIKNGSNPADLVYLLKINYTTTQLGFDAKFIRDIASSVNALVYAAKDNHLISRDEMVILPHDNTNREELQYWLTTFPGSLLFRMPKEFAGIHDREMG